MATTFRFPRTGPTTWRRGLQVTIDGQEPPYVVECRTTRGFDQDMATAEIVCPHPMPSWIMENSRVVLSMGDPDSTEPGGGLVVSFTGYVRTFSSSLYPGRHTAICQDVLWTASRARSPNEFSLASLTDTEAVTFLLSGLYPAEMLDIQGLGLLLSDTDDIQFLVTEERTVLEIIKEIDKVGQGWRTYATTDGRIVRRPISIIPTDTPVRTFTEGLDMFDGESDTDDEDAYTDVHIVSPAGSYLFDPSNPDYVAPDLSIRSNPYWQRLIMLSQVATSMTHLSMQDQAAWLYSQMSKKLIRGSFSTHVDTLFQGSETIAPTSEHLEIGQSVFIQNVQRAVSARGKFSQTISWLSERTAANRGITVPFTVDSSIRPLGPLAAPAVQTTVPASASDVLASFAILSIVRQLVVRGGVDTFIYHVACQDTSTSRSGTIATRAWTASGPGVTTTTGDALYFSTTFTDLTTATIAETVTDILSNSASVTRSLANPGVPTMIEKIYAISDKAEAFDGNVWRTHTPSGGRSLTAVAHGPFFAAEDLAIVTADDFQTAGVESTPFTGADVIGAVWKEPDVATAFAAATNDGNVALSNNGSTGWSIKTDPTGAPILRIIVSRFQPGEIHLISSTGYWVSDNYGSGWRLVRAGSFVDLNLAAHSWNVLVGSDGSLIDASTGTAFTFPSLSPAVSIVAATHHIRAKGVYALDTEGRTYYTSPTAYGSMALVQGSSMPVGEAQERGIYRSGIAVGKIYVAGGSGGLMEHTNGFQGDFWELIRAGSTSWP